MEESKVFKFPNGFLWGAATSAHQVEGDNHNDWTEWEKANAERLAREATLRPAQGGKWQPWQQDKFPEMFNPQNYISGRACDHYNRYEEDFDIAKSLGHNAHRFSIEWSRIEPEEGKFNEEAIEHYRQVIRALRERGIEPFVTLWHYTNPLWISKAGGWENKKTIDYFVRYVDKIAETIGKEIRYWISINEPTVYAGHAYVIGIFPPEIKSLLRANRVLKNLISAHKLVYKLLHQKLGNTAMVGMAHNLHYHVSFNVQNILDLLSTKILNYFRDTRYLNWIRKYQDFIGLNYYFRDTVKFVLWGGRLGVIDIKNSNVDISDLGWDIFPKGIYHTLKYLKKYKKPIYITENGLADATDKKKAKFISKNLRWINRAMQEGIDVRGYFYWSLLDNIEWRFGFWPRFGLVEIDYATLQRKVRASARAYKSYIESGL